MENFTKKIDGLISKIQNKKDVLNEATAIVQNLDFRNLLQTIFNPFGKTGIKGDLSSFMAENLDHGMDFKYNLNFIYTLHTNISSKSISMEKIGPSIRVVSSNLDKDQRRAMVMALTGTTGNEKLDEMLFDLCVTNGIIQKFTPVKYVLKDVERFSGYPLYATAGYGKKTLYVCLNKNKTIRIFDKNGNFDVESETLFEKEFISIANHPGSTMFYCNVHKGILRVIDFMPLPHFYNPGRQYAGAFQTKANRVKELQLSLFTMKKSKIILPAEEKLCMDEDELIDFCNENIDKNGCSSIIVSKDDSLFNFENKNYKVKFEEE